jgi:hypothetical protein
LYVTDTWHIKPNVTLTYGLVYVVEMPAYEVNGNLPMVVYSDNSEFTAESYLAQRKTAALAGPLVAASASAGNQSDRRKTLEAQRRGRPHRQARDRLYHRPEYPGRECPTPTSAGCRKPTETSPAGAV